MLLPLSLLLRLHGPSKTTSNPAAALAACAVPGTAAPAAAEVPASTCCCCWAGGEGDESDCGRGILLPPDFLRLSLRSNDCCCCGVLVRSGGLDTRAAPPELRGDATADGNFEPAAAAPGVVRLGGGLLQRTGLMGVLMLSPAGRPFLLLLLLLLLMLLPVAALGRVGVVALAALR